jgi:hypothetical protein
MPFGEEAIGLRKGFEPVCVGLPKEIEELLFFLCLKIDGNAGIQERVLCRIGPAFGRHLSTVMLVGDQTMTQVKFAGAVHHIEESVRVSSIW